MTRLLIFFIKSIILFVAFCIIIILIFKWAPFPGSMLIVEKKISSWSDDKNIQIKYKWTDWENISNNIKISVIAGEDQKFPLHYGFDFKAIQQALIHNINNSSNIRGASTITQQVSKNAFLWPERSIIRKFLEAWFTLLIEVFWSKERILEVYLNIIEWGPNIFGITAASQYYFNTLPNSLSQDQASLLAAIIPNPIKWSANNPTTYIQNRAAWIQQQTKQLGLDSYLNKLN